MISSTGGPGNDTISGGAGSDTIYGDDYADPLQPGGSDYIVGDAQLHNNLPPSGQGNDVIFGGAGNDFINGEGSNDYLDGGPGDDTLWGGYGPDLLFGRDGDDHLWGGSSPTRPATVTVSWTHPIPSQMQVNGGIQAVDDASADVLRGGAGDDHLHGQLGNDQLVGGSGSDRFYFETALNPATNVDTMGDFTPREDTIVLSQAIFTGIGSKFKKGHLAIGKKAKDGNDRFVYDKKNGLLLSDDDGKGGDPAVLFATLDAKLKLSHKDFDMIA
jgi:Ca2+-binding RTX toxin-like protein